MIEQAIVEWVEGSAPLVAKLPGGVYVDLKDSSAPGAYMVITMVNNQRPVNLRGEPKQCRAHIQIDIYAASAVDVRAAGELLVVLMNGQSATYAGRSIQWAELESERSGIDSDGDLRRQTYEFNVYYH